MFSVIRSMFLLLMAGLSCGVFSAPLNKYQMPTFEVPTEQRTTVTPFVAVPDVPLVRRPVLNMGLSNPASSVYAKPTRIIQGLTKEQQRSWQEVYGRKRDEARQESRIDEYIYYDNLVRITEMEIVKP